VSTLAQDIEPRVVKWLWFDRIPRGMISLLAGLPDGGKSLFTIYLTAQVSRLAAVLISAREDPAHEVLRPRLEAAGANLSRVRLANHVTLPSGIDYLAREIAEHQVELLIIDPVADHLDGGVHRSTDSIRQVTHALADLAEQTGVAILLVEHALKSVSRNAHPLAAIAGGNSGLRAAARMAFIGGKDPDDSERVLLCAVKHNISAEPKPLAFTLDSARFADSNGNESTTSVLTFREEADFDVMDLLVKPKNEKAGRPPAKRARAAEWLAAYLSCAPDHEAPVKDVEEDARSVGITLHTLDRAAKLDVGVERFQRGRVWWWRLPQELIDAAERDDEDDGDHP